MLEMGSVCQLLPVHSQHERGSVPPGHHARLSMNSECDTSRPVLKTIVQRFVSMKAIWAATVDVHQVPL